MSPFYPPQVTRWPLSDIVTSNAQSHTIVIPRVVVISNYANYPATQATMGIPSGEEVSRIEKIKNEVKTRAKNVLGPRKARWM